MPRKSVVSKNANGIGSIRKKVVKKKNGTVYQYWEARYTESCDPATKKQIQRSITGKTQKEVAQKLKAITASLDAGTYIPPSKMTVGDWLDVWEKDYLGKVKPLTVNSYRTIIRVHIKPVLGFIKLDELSPHMIQRFYNALAEGDSPLSPKTIKNVHGVMHKALAQAVKIGYLRMNVADSCELPRVEKKELRPLDEEETRIFIEAIKGNRFETLFLVTLFTGMREGEVLGLKWDRVDFNRGTILIDRQLSKLREGKVKYVLASTKNGKGRMITPAPYVMDWLKHHKAVQAEQQLRMGSLWVNDGFVFTNEQGQHLNSIAIYRAFKKVVTSIGRPDARFHDLRHSYAVASLRAGDDIKTVQGNLGHATAAFTLDVYGHVTDQMKKASAARMEQYIEQVMNP